jgi:hypothetical protein
LEKRYAKVVNFFTGRRHLAQVRYKYQRTLLCPEWSSYGSLTYSDISNPIQVARCFQDEIPLVAAGENFLDEKSVSKPFFLEANRPYDFDGQTILLARLGVKYFIMYNGHKVGPAFNYVLVDTEGESEMVGVTAGQGRYVFRGIRNGHYYLIEISQNNATISGLAP